MSGLMLFYLEGLFCLVECPFSSSTYGQAIGPSVMFVIIIINGLAAERLYNFEANLLRLFAEMHR